MPLEYYKNRDIVRLLGVSDATVNRWVSNALLGKNNLEIEEFNGKFRILKSENNNFELKNLTDSGNKYKTTDSLKKSQVGQYFYEVFTEDQQLELYLDLVFKREINLKYWYKNGGALQWDEFYHKNFGKFDKMFDELLNNSLESLNYYLGDGQINLIDIGGGNALPVKNLISKLKNVVSYLGVDISEEMLDIALANVKKWYPKLITSKSIKDIENDRIVADVLGVKSIFAGNNLIAYFGNTLCNQPNFIDILIKLRSCMLPDDVLVFSVATLDSSIPIDLEYAKTDESYGWIPKLMGIDIEKCQTVYRWDSNIKAKIKESILDKDYEIEFKLLGKKQILQLEKGEKIRRWYHHLFTIDEITNACDLAGLDIKSLLKSDDNSGAVIICKPKKYIA